MHPDPASTTQLLRRAGLRVTAHRYAVVEWLDEHPHSTADEVGTGVRERLGSISKQTVYDVLGACVEAGLVRQMEPAGHPALFERHTDENHHHLICRSCGRIEDADCEVGTRPCMNPDDDQGFALDEAEVMFWGACPTCQTAGPGRSAAEEVPSGPDAV